MKVPVRNISGVIPYIIILDKGTEVIEYKGRKKKPALFSTREAAEEVALRISKFNPSWKVTVKKSNGVPL